jgi:hypothetical protein
MSFVKASRKKIKLKLGICGGSGSGKTYSALRLAHGLGQKVALIDTENGSASLYSDKFSFDTLDMSPPFTHEKFIAAIHDAEAAGYDVLVIDSASHFWEGILEYKSKLDARGGNSYTNWNDAGNKFKGILDSVLQSKMHVICCMRSKMDYVQEKDDRGKTTIKKVGLAPIMRDGIQYEFTTVWDVDQNHQAQSSKDRTGLFGDGIEQITENHGKRLLEWLASGAAPAPANPKVDVETGEQRTAIIRPNDKQLAAVGVLNALIEQGGGEDGIKQREQQRVTYKYSDPAVQIQKRMDLCQALGLEPDEEQAATLRENGYPWKKV